MDGNNILLYFQLLGRIIGLLLKVIPRCLAFCISLCFFFPSCSIFLSPAWLSVFFSTAPPMCTLTPNPFSPRRRASPSLQCLRPQSCDADLLCFTRLQCREGGLRGKELRSPAAGNKAQLGGEKLCVWTEELCVCVSACGWVEGGAGSSISSSGTPL